MMSWSLALTRAALIGVGVGAVGSLLLMVALNGMGIRPTITDLQGEVRVNIVWWALTAFVACAACVLGMIGGGMALTSSGLATPLRSVTRVAPVLAAVVVLPAILLWNLGHLSERTALPFACGAVIGILAGAAYVVQRGVPEENIPWFQERERDHRVWGSR